MYLVFIISRLNLLMSFSSISYTDMMDSSEINELGFLIIVR